MKILLWSLAIIGIIALSTFTWAVVSSYVWERKEKRWIKRRADAFDLVIRQISDCKYWLNGQDKEVFYLLFNKMIDHMALYHHLSGDAARRIADDIVSQLENIPTFKPQTPKI